VLVSGSRTLGEVTSDTFLFVTQTYGWARGSPCKGEKVHRRQSNHVKVSGVPGKEFPRQAMRVYTQRRVRVTTVAVEKQ